MQPASELIEGLKEKVFFQGINSIEWMKARLVKRHPISSIKALAKSNLQKSLAKESDKLARFWKSCHTKNLLIGIVAEIVMSMEGIAQVGELGVAIALARGDVK